MIVDLHAHAPGFVPRPWSDAYRWANRRTMPADAPLPALLDAGVATAVVCAVGDPVVTRWYRGDPWRALIAQLDAVDAAAATAPDLHVIGGLEGADALGDDLARVVELARRGVRVVVPVHLADNQFGTTCLPWQHYVSERIPLRRRRATGLSELGGRLVAALQAERIVVDLSHADAATAHDIIDASMPGACVIASHSGARAVTDFARFLDDDLLRRVAATGGVVGLWPYCHRGHGVADLPTLVAHARHVAATAGVEHLAIGTDVNGVPGTSAGYRGIHDVGRIAGALRDGGFGADDVASILHGNARRVLAATTPH